MKNSSSSSISSWFFSSSMSEWMLNTAASQDVAKVGDRLHSGGLLDDGGADDLLGLLVTITLGSITSGTCSISKKESMVSELRLKSKSLKSIMLLLKDESNPMLLVLK